MSPAEAQTGAPGLVVPGEAAECQATPGGSGMTKLRASSGEPGPTSVADGGGGVEGAQFEGAAQQNSPRSCAAEGSVRTSNPEACACSTRRAAVIAPAPLCDTASSARQCSQAHGSFTFASQAPLPTMHGAFLMRVYICRESGKEAVAMLSPALVHALHLAPPGTLLQRASAPARGAEATPAQAAAIPSSEAAQAPASQELVPLVRVHDACATSELFGSLKCDCRLQLESAMQLVQAEPAPHGGMVVYLNQEGRGIGLSNKVAAYALQACCGADTVDANRALGLPDDIREYGAVADILRDVGVPSVRLMTNNPRKVRLLQEAGVAVKAQVPHHVPAPSEYAAAYVACKVSRMAHVPLQTKEGGEVGH